MCAFTGDEEAADAEQHYMTERRAKLFSGSVESKPSMKTHMCRNDEEYGEMLRPWRVTHDGGYTEWWCRVCMRYFRVMVPTDNRAAA